MSGSSRDDEASEPHFVEVGADQQLSEAIVDAVSEFVDVDPLDLPPLYETIDPDALDSLFSAPVDDRDSRDVRVTFTFSDVEVSVLGGSRIRLERTPRSD